MMTEGLLWEVLLRLPTKSLMRFKCVSKLWCSIIRNPRFTSVRLLHGFRGLLITDLRYTYFSSSPLPPRFFYANLNASCPVVTSPHLTIQEEDYTRVTPVVKGLIGLYDCYNCVFTLCNVATHELVKLPPSPSPDLDMEYFYHYFLGFDVIEEVYKVLCLLRCYDRENNLYGETNSHVFTLGVDMKWRIITLPPVDLVHPSQQCLCIDGALYWLPYKCRKQETLTSFNLNSEAFEAITIPECTNDGCDLVEICASPALVVIDLTTEYAEVFDIWTMNSHCRGEWTRTRVFLPMGFKHPGTSLTYTGTLPTGEMMFAPIKEIMSAERVLDILPLPIYVYDHHKNESKSITIQNYGFQESGTDSQEHGMDDHQIKICYYEENIISLDYLMSNQEQDQATISD